MSEGPACSACFDGRFCRDHWALMREKVEALEKRCEEQQLVLTYLQGLTTGIGSRIDAALRRIEELERWSANYHAVAHRGANP